MGSHARFLPPHLLLSVARRGPPARLPHVERFPAALLFSDISGFTSLTERLQAQGREGAEEIAAAVNNAFAPAIRAIEKWGGSIVSFGGDALFAVFLGRSRVRRAFNAAEAIQERFARRREVVTNAGPVRLAISQAVHHGLVTGLHLGTPERRHYLLTGPAVVALARLEAKARGGKLLLSSAARREIRRAGACLPRACRGGPPPDRSIGGPHGPALRSYLEPRLLPLLGRFEGEYRRVAVLFIETGGANAGLLQSFFLALRSALDRTEGVLLKTDLSAAGTKWLCVLGVPQSHEDDPDRSARLALDVLREAPKALRVRAGLHAGTVANIVIGTRDRRSFDVMGDVVNTAARAMAQASWGEVLVTGKTRKLLSGVDTEPRGTRAVKGKAAPLELHCLKGARAIVKQIRVSAPMIGRDAELRQIVEALERAKAGGGSVIGIKGEAGMGKSRLKYEASKVARQMGVEVHEGRAISFGGMAYWTIGALLRDILGLPDVPEKAEVLAKVAGAADRLGMKPVDRHHLAEVLGVRYDDSPIEHLRPQDIRLNNMIAVRTFCQAIATEKTRLLVLEDMHWADGASIEAAQSLAKAAGSSRFAVLLLYRPGYGPPEGATEIQLSELGAEAVDALLGAHLGLVSERVGRLVKERAGGNPFYVEEVVRHLLETGILRLSDEGYQLLREVRSEDLPHTVEAVIAARLDGLSAGARRVAQHGAVIGRSFVLSLLARFDELSEVAAEGIAELVLKEIVFERVGRGLVPHLREYTFKHALTRDVAYESILGARRRKLHRAVADGIEELFAKEREMFLPMLGDHRERAGQRDDAMACYLAGARAAASRFAHEEAERCYRAYLRLVPGVTEESIRARNELGAKVLQLRGRTKEAEGEYRRALEDARELSHRGLQGESLRLLALVLWRTGRMEEARELHEQALAIRLEAGDRRGEGTMLGNLASLHHEQGRVGEARALYERALAIHCEVGDRSGKGIALGNLASLYHDEGRMGEARTFYEQALTIVREVGGRRNEGIVLGNLALLHQEQGRMDEARALYEQAFAVHCEVGDRGSEGTVIGNLAMLHQEQGRMEESQALFEQALAIARDVGDRRDEGIWLGYLSGWELLAGGPNSAGERLAEQGEVLLLSIGDQMELAELICTRGHIALAAGRCAADILKRVRALGRGLGCRPESKLGKSTAALERAQAAFEAGAALVRGYCPEDLSSGQLRWIREHRPGAIPPEVGARLNEDGTLRPAGPQ